MDLQTNIKNAIFIANSTTPAREVSITRKRDRKMANKRMFTMKICDSDAFLDMPLSTQCLYFHLNMRADDDGFIGNSKRIARLIGASDDDLKLLIAKRFVIPFEDGVMVIKHWRMHNTLSQNRYHETQYIEEKNMLKIKENGAYSLTDGTPIDDTKKIEASTRQSRRNKDATKTDSELVLDKELDLGLDKVCYQLGDEHITHRQYNDFVEDYGKEIVDQVIKRILDHPYYGCLNPDTIARWCEEQKNRPKQKATNKFNNFDQRNYSKEQLSALERMAIGGN